MVISKRNACIALVLVGAVVAQVGCGKAASKRQHVDRLLDKDGKPLGGNNAKIDSAVPQKITSLLNQQDALKQGNPELDLTKLLGAGTYTLKSVFTTYHYQLDTIELAAVSTSNVNLNNDIAALTIGSMDNAGSATPDIDTGLQLELPVRFAMKADGSIARESSLVKTLKNTNSDSATINELAEANDSSANSLMNILTRRTDVSAGTVVTYLNADNGATLRVVYAIDESKMDPVRARVIILDYGFSAEAAAAAPAGGEDTALTNANAPVVGPQ